MNVVIPRLADIILKQIGVVGIEAHSLYAYIKSIWDEYANDYLDDFFKYVLNLETGELNQGAINTLWFRHQLSLDFDFIDVVANSKEFDYYIEESYKQGIRSVGVVSKQDIEEELLQEVVQLTGSTLANTKRTIRRWFEETQGKYFDRFIKAETDRMFLQVQDTDDLTTIRELGKRYKQFVEADGYWSGISGFDTNTSKVFGQVEALDKQNITTYQIVATFTAGTCPVCEHLHGTTWQVAEALGEIEDLTLIGAGEDPKTFNPWPDRSIVETYPNPQDSPYRIPPFHLNCNCNVIAF